MAYWWGHWECVCVSECLHCAVCSGFVYPRCWWNICGAPDKYVQSAGLMYACINICSPSVCSVQHFERCCWGESCAFSFSFMNFAFRLTDLLSAGRDGGEYKKMYVSRREGAGTKGGVLKQEIRSWLNIWTKPQRPPGSSGANRSTPHAKKITKKGLQVVALCTNPPFFLGLCFVFRAHRSEERLMDTELLPSLGDRCILHVPLTSKMGGGGQGGREGDGSSAGEVIRRLRDVVPQNPTSRVHPSKEK